MPTREAGRPRDARSLVPGSFGFFALIAPRFVGDLPEADRRQLGQVDDVVVAIDGDQVDAFASQQPIDVAPVAVVPIDQRVVRTRNVEQLIV